ncbi:glycine--tRNA ligase subunit beta [Dongia sp.]|uniref:glycine--tRNA ligase subunit beta n=1 Tax=Dongia sp. TaxID=1977262 RepID=UPI0035B18ECC
MAELLLELFSEEIPARMQARAAEDLQRLVTEKLKAAGLTFTSAKSFVTPRRLALVVDGLPLQSADEVKEEKGPKVGSPQQAIDGFLKKHGLSSLDQCEKRDTGKGEFYFAVIEKKGATTSTVVDQFIDSVLMDFAWPKSMRWAGNDFRWVRPLHSIMLIFDGKPSSRSEFELGTVQNKDRGKVSIGDKSKGHRFLSPGEITVSSFADYQAKLKAAKVILDQAERKASIKAQAEKIAAEAGLTVKPDDGLLEEVTGLVEWPTVLMGKIDDEFMSVPHEVLTTSMRVNQKYFALLGKDGKLAPRFLVTANIEANDGGKAIVHGNERVLRARLSDAKFFWDQDLKTTLAERVPALDPITYHAKLGSVGDKVRRVKALSREVAKYVPGCEAGLANQAAALAKADLVSGMVGEFPELQGIMGRYYARAEKLPEEVADAIADHYKPLGPNDSCPRAPVSVAVALADKIDTLTGFFAIDEKPTGSKDPFALRRAALGIIRLILENKLRLPLREVLAAAYRGYQGVAGFGDSVPKEVSADLMEFFADRLKVALKEQGVRHDLVAAVFALGDEDDLTRLLARVEALKALIDSADGANLLAGYKRAANILRIEEKKDGVAYADAPDAVWLKLDEEKALHQALGLTGKAVTEAIGKEDFGKAMVALAGLRAPVDAFFDKVTVNADEKELRGNRLRLLNAIRATFNQVADFSRIEG